MKNKTRKIFGGYTPIPWTNFSPNNYFGYCNSQTLYGDGKKMDPSETSFVMSVNYRTLFRLRKNMPAITNINLAGPCFG